MGNTLVSDVGDRGIGKISELGRQANKRSTWTASESVSGDLAASHGSGDVQVIPIDQEVVIARPGITNSENNLARNLALDVDVELLDRAELEIVVLGKNGARKSFGLGAEVKD